MGNYVFDGSNTTVGSAAVQVVAANTWRRAVVIQNVGAEPCRIGSSAVTATSGLRLAAGGSVTFREPSVVQGAIWAVREGTADTTLTFLEVRG